MAQLEYVNVAWQKGDIVDIIGRGALATAAADFEGSRGLAVLALYGISQKEYDKQACGQPPVVAYEDDNREWHIGTPERLSLHQPGNRPAIALRMPKHGINRAGIGFRNAQGAPNLLNTAGITTHDMPHYSVWDLEGVRVRIPSSLVDPGVLLLARQRLGNICVARNMP